MVQHVTIVAILMITQGVLEAFMALLFLAASFIAPQFVTAASPPANTAKNIDPQAMGQLVQVVYLVLALPALLAAVLHITAGIRTLFLRGRTLGLVALIGGACSIASIYCAPTTIALLVYGMIVYMQPDVVQAFALAEQGHPLEDIRRRAALGTLDELKGRSEQSQPYQG